MDRRHTPAACTANDLEAIILYIYIYVYIYIYIYIYTKLGEFNNRVSTRRMRHALMRLGNREARDDDYTLRFVPPISAPISSLSVITGRVIT